MYNTSVERSKPVLKTAFWAILLIGIGVRCIGLISRPIWYDEAFALLMTQKGPFAIFDATLVMQGGASADIHPPGYYLLLWAWVQVWGSSVTAGRLLSIILSIGTLTCVYYIAKTAMDQRTAILAMLLAAILPFQVHYGVEIRMYSLLTLLLALATLAFWKGMRTGQWTWWLLFSISAAAAQYTHNLAAFYLIPLAAIGLLRKDWKTVRSTVAAGLGAILIYSPWLLHLPAQIAKIGQNYWVQRPNLARFFTLAITYVTNLPLPESLLPVGFAISLLLIVLAGFQTYITVKQKTEFTSMGCYFGYLGWVPPVFLWIVSQFQPVYIERALLPAQLMFCVWIAWVILHTNLPHVLQGLFTVMILASVVLGITQHVTYQGFPYAPYTAASSYLLENQDDHALIVHSNKLTYLPMLYLTPELSQTFIIDEPGSTSDSLAPATRKILELSELASIEEAMAKADRIWLVIFDQAIAEYQAAGFDTHPHLAALEGEYQRIAEQSFGEMRVLGFEK